MGRTRQLSNVQRPTSDSRAPCSSITHWQAKDRTLQIPDLRRSQGRRIAGSRAVRLVSWDRLHRDLHYAYVSTCMSIRH